MTKIISDKIIRKTNKGCIRYVTFTKGTVVCAEYQLFDNRGDFVQSIRTPFRVADYR